MLTFTRKKGANKGPQLREVLEDELCQDNVGKLVRVAAAVLSPAVTSDAVILLLRTTCSSVPWAQRLNSCNIKLFKANNK